MTVSRDDKVVAVIVTHNPDLETLRENINLLKTKVMAILIVDNNSVNLDKLRELEINNVWLLPLDKNYGLGKAYDQAISFISTNSIAKWILTLDDDSKINTCFDLSKPISAFNSLNNIVKNKIGLITINKDYAVPRQDSYYGADFYEVKFVVNTGRLLPVNVARKFRFREDFFVDHIDTEYCLRLRKEGFILLAYKDQMLLHDSGLPTLSDMGSLAIPLDKRNSRLIKILFRFFKKNQLKIHVEKRNYLIQRNATYLFVRTRLPFKIFLSSLLVPLIEVYMAYGPKESIKILLSALYHGIKGDLEKNNYVLLLQD